MEQTNKHSILEVGNLLMVQERERLLARLLTRYGWNNLADLKVFEAGCSTGYNLRQVLQWGASPQNLAGMDLDPEAVAYCKAHAPEIRIHEGSAERIPEPDQSFDISLAFTLFSSLPDEEISQGVADELFRITRPGGLILIYDIRRASPTNRNVHAIDADDIRRWFPKCPVRIRSITLAPPIARRIGRWAPGLYTPLAAVPILRTHSFVVLRRPAMPPLEILGATN